MRRVVALTSLSIVLAVSAGCGGSSGTKGTTTPGGYFTTPSYTFGPTTTFMSDCAVMPTPEAISAIVGIPLDAGIVIATGTCEFRGLNDQNRRVTLALHTDPVDVASFNDLVASVGTTTPIADAPVAGMFIAPDFRIGLIVNGAVYTVQTTITDQAPQDQYPLSVAVLAAWVSG